MLNDISVQKRHATRSRFGKQILSNRKTLDGLVRCFDGACYELLKLVGTSETASREKEKFDFT